jgi:NtrC-family two-component system response regulator AlgB
MEQRLEGLRVLVIDDERNIRSALRVCLEQAGSEVVEAATPEAALAALAQRPFDLAFVDLRLGVASGLDLLPQLLAEDAGLDVVVVTAYATFDTALATTSPNPSPRRRFAQSSAGSPNGGRSAPG